MKRSTATEKVVEIIQKHCTSSRTITGARTGIFKRRIEVSIDATGNQKSKRVRNAVKKIVKIERELQEAFPKRKIMIRVRAGDKKSFPKKVSEPFKGKDIIVIRTPVKVNVQIPPVEELEDQD